MSCIHLTGNASPAEIATAIRTVQARCKKGLCPDPDALGALVVEQLERLRDMANAAGVRIQDLRPHMEAWGSGLGCAGDGNGDMTIVMFDGGGGLRVLRKTPMAGQRSGCISLSLRARGDQY